MTGYGRGELNSDYASLSIEIKSVNHRNFEFSLRVTKGYGYLEQKIKQYISAYITRGKVDVYVTIDTLNNGVDLKIDENLAAAYINAIKELSKNEGIDGNVSAYDIMRLPDIVKISSPVASEEQMWDLFLPVCTQAVEKFVQAREIEGEKIKENILIKIELIKKYLSYVEELYPTCLVNYRQRLELNLKETLSDINIDTQRILMECAIFADRTCIDEETVRLSSHISELYSLLDSEQPIGRKFDFIIQEINREINTIASKSQDVGITKLTVEMKSEVEKIREQIQNIE